MDMQQQDRRSAAEIGRQLMRNASKGALGTIDITSGGPYVSLIGLVTLPDNTPIFLISNLAEHTANLSADPRVSLLLDDTSGLDDPLTGPRLSLVGKASPLAPPVGDARTRYLDQHPGAAVYVDFTDFRFFKFEILRAHFVGGFGKISNIPISELTLPTSQN